MRGRDFLRGGARTFRLAAACWLIAGCSGRLAVGQRELRDATTGNNPAGPSSSLIGATHFDYRAWTINDGPDEWRGDRISAIADDVTAGEPIGWRPLDLTEKQFGNGAIESLLEDADLAGRFVYFIDFDDRGNAWIASTEGLIFYDGYTWTRFTEQDGLPSNNVRSLVVARDGTVWIGTDNGVATRDSHGRISVPRGAEQAGINVRRIIEDDDGTLWFCSDTWLKPSVPSGLASRRQGVWTVYRERDGLPSNYISGYFRDSAGRHFVLSRDGLAIQDHGHWSRPLETTGLAGHDEYFWSIAESSAGEVIATTDSALFVLKNNEWSRTSVTQPEHAHLQLTTTGSGEVVAISSGNKIPKRFLRWTGTGFTPVSDAAHLRGQATYITEGPDGSIWAVGYNLLLRWTRSDAEWTEFDGVSAPKLVDSEGRIWFTADETIVRLSEGNRWESFDSDIDEIKAGSGTDVLGWSNDTFYQFTSKRVIVHEPEQTGIHEIKGCTLDAAGKAWLWGMDRRGRTVVRRLDGSGWHGAKTPEFQHDQVIDVASEPTGGIHFLMRDEVSRTLRLVHIDGTGAHPIDMPEVAAAHAEGVHVNYRGHLWLYGHFGLYTFEGSIWRRIEELPSERIFAAVNGSNETWIAYDGIAGGATGVGRLKDETWSFHSVSTSPRVFPLTPGSTALFGSDTALYRSIESGTLAPLPLPIEHSVLDAIYCLNGDVWIGLGDSVVRYRSDGRPPQTQIVAAADEVLEGDSLAVTFRGVERFRPQRDTTLSYSWRVGPGAWSKFQPAPSGPLSISLRPGQYAFEVRARDDGLDVEVTPARTEFRVLAIPLAQRSWFFPVAIGAIVGLALVVCLAVIARNRSKYQAVRLELLVTDRTAKLRQQITERERAEERLQQAHDNLETRVIERTAELTNANQTLRAEVAERKRAEKAREQLTEQLHQSQKMEAMGQLAAGVAHDFNNLLMVMLGRCDQARGLLPAGSGALEALHETEQAALKARELTASLLTFSRQGPSKRKPVDLCNVLDQAGLLIRTALPIDVELVIETCTPPIWIIADGNLVQQLLLNLAINARDAMPDGGSLRISINRAPQEQIAQLVDEPVKGAPFALIEVTDTGTGMTAEVRSHALEPFYTTKPRGQGTGLGLAIVLGIVQDHSGLLEIETEKDKGCKIKIILPGIDADSVVHSHDPMPAQASGQGESILFLSDKATERAIITAMLQSSGYEVVQTATEESFRDQFESIGGRIRLLLIDLHQPDDDGLACLRRLRDDGAVTAAIVVTGDGGLQLEAPLKFNTTLLYRPFQMTDLERLVATCVQESCPPEEAR